MEKKRFDYIDIAKGIGILMVVWAHIMIVGWSHRMIYAFHMPLFFFLSGMLFRSDKYPSFRSFFVRRAKRLLIPYAIYSVVTWVIWVVFRLLRHDEVASYFNPLLQTVIAQGSGAFFVHNSALWFIPCLFLVEILYYFISKLGWHWSILVCFGCAVLSFVLGNIFGSKYWFTPPWNADAALIALPFYAFGHLLIVKIGHDKLVNAVSRHWIVSFLIWIIATGALLWSSMAFNECSMGSSSYHCSAWIFMTRAFFGIAWLLLFSILFSTIKKLDIITSSIKKYTIWAGVHSLDIMCLHIPLKGFFMIIVAMAAHVSSNAVGENYLLSLGAFALTMIAAGVIILLIDRFIRSKE